MIDHGAVQDGRAGWSDEFDLTKNDAMDWPVTMHEVPYHEDWSGTPGTFRHGAFLFDP